MGLGNAPDVPNVPDYTQVAALQQGANDRTATQNIQAGSGGQENVFGSLDYNQVGTGAGGVPIYRQKVTLSPEQQKLYNTLVGTQGGVGDEASNLLAGAHYGDAQPFDVIGDAATGNTNKLMQMYMAANKPYQDVEREQLETKLKNRGINEESPAWLNALAPLIKGQNTANLGALAGYEDKAFGQAKDLYNLPAELGMKLAGFASPTTPKGDFMNPITSNAQPANYIGAAANQSQAQMAAYNADLQKYSSALSGAFGIPTAVLGGWAKSGFTNPFAGAAAAAV